MIRDSERFFRPVDCASLVVFRVLFGAIMLVEVVRYWSRDWIFRFYLQPEFLFKYQGFEWVQPWPGDGLYWHFGVLGVAALCLSIGAFYRLAAVTVFLCFSYIFLLDQARYLNHFYLVMLFAFLLIFLPANKAYSVDAWLFPRLRRSSVPVLGVWALRGQMEVFLIYAGLVKLNPDWLRLEPLKLWLATRADFPLIGHMFTEDWVVACGAYGAILLHVVGAPLLLWSRTRLPIFVLYCAFHVMNHFLFSIGIFPWFAIAGTLMFFPPDWPRRAALGAAAALARLGVPYSSGHTGTPAQAAAHARCGALSLARKAALCGLAAWFAVQILVPIRHHLYPGRPSWTEEGHRFAWRMKLRSKRGHARFEVRDPVTGRTWQVTNRDYLTARQNRKMSRDPQMIAVFARHLKTVWAAEKNVPNAEVRAHVMVSLNGRRPALLVDPDRDLSTVTWDIWPADWILPLREPLLRTAKAGASGTKADRTVMLGP